MTCGSMCAALRLMWAHCLVHSKKVLNPLAFQESREKLANFAHNGFTFSRSRSNAKEAVQKVNISVRKSTLLTRHCNVIAGQRVWRAFQIVTSYRQLYGEKLMLQTLRANFSRPCKNGKLYLMLCTTCIFKWERDGVSDEELNRALSEMEMMERLLEHAAKSKASPTRPAPEGWEMFVDGKHLKVWRRFMKEYNQFEYRGKAKKKEKMIYAFATPHQPKLEPKLVYGSFSDITPRAFYNTQMDLKFWCGWDPQTLYINVIDTDITSNSEIIHWVYKYPYPMYPRDYCYVRRSMVNGEINKMAIRARAVPHHKCPEDQKIVRVREYQSQLVITPNSTFDENGFCFYLTYFDNPQAQVPKICYNWMASTGVPDFVERLHTAAQVMQKRTQEGYQPKISVSIDASELKKESRSSGILVECAAVPLSHTFFFTQIIKFIACVG